MRAKKRLGQHFLHHRAILERIADALDPAAGELVLEIGPGQGTLTAVLAARGARVVAIEKDAELLPGLEQRLPGVRFVPGDALELDWHAVLGVGPGEPFTICGNIPYNITSPLIDKALIPPRPGRIVFLVQKEVALRLAAPAAAEDYGALSVGVQAVARVERLFTVPAGAFHPPPRVHSAVVRMTPREVPLVTDQLVAPFRRLVVGLFGFRRKQLVRGLRELTGWSPERVTPILRRAGIEPGVRPEVLSPERFVGLLDLLIDEGWVPG